MITEDYVSFETAKLLKEKGYWNIATMLYKENGDIVNYNVPLNNKGFSTTLGEFYEAPTLQSAMKWLREEYKMHCDIGYDDLDWFWNILDIDNAVPVEERPKIIKNGFAGYSSYEQACEAAINYCLKNLIKNEDEEEESDIPVPKTVDEAISTLVKILSDEDREYLLENGAISMHDSLGRWIRNEWGLWTGSELKDELMKMNKGLNHPDDMSNYIIEEFIKYWNNKL